MPLGAAGVKKRAHVHLGGRPPRVALVICLNCRYNTCVVIRKRLELAGPAVVFVTTTVRGWIPLLSLDRVASMAIEELNSRLAIYPVSISVYVFMPFHLRMILLLKSEVTPSGGRS